MTGAELRAWRERLGLTREDASRAIGNALARRESINAETVERLEGNRTFYGDPAPYVDAYRAALEAEEARQSAERGPVEPVCPEGVTTWLVMGTTGRTCVALSRLHNPVVVVEPDGCVISSAFDKAPASPALLEYAAALSRYRATLHAASDRQRKLDAVRAAEEAHNAQKRAGEELRQASWAAEVKTARALDTARREAGL